jgi:hypothetical protein
MSRKVIVEQLRDYFASKGGVMTADQYKEAEDAPIRMQVLKRKLGPWPRIMNMLDMKVEEAYIPSLVEQTVQEEPEIEKEEEPEIEKEAPAVEEKPKAAPKTKGA